MTKLSVACIGAGYFAQFHYDAWKRLESTVPIASVDTDISKAQSTGLEAFRTSGELYDRVAPDIVDIITPPSTHLDEIKKAMSKGVQAIICQKPFCESIEQAREAIDLSKTTGIPVIIHENFRFQPWYRKAKEILGQGLLGDLHQLTFRLRPGDGQGSDAYLDRQPYFQKMERFLVHETAIHWIDTFRYLLGEPTGVFAELRRMNPMILGEDSGHILFEFPNNVRALFDGNRSLDHAAKNTRCTMGEALIEGTKGSLTLSGDGSLSFRDFGETQSQIILLPSTSKQFGGDCVFNLCSHVADALANGGSYENLAQDYLTNMHIEEAIYASSQERRWIDLLAKEAR